MAETATTATQAEKLYDRRIYDIWYHMMRRCNDPADAHYSYYGGRGITVCDEWHSYHAFAMWARASGYEEHLTIDRINNDDGYGPDNCRWATYQAQANNRRSSRRITAAGRTMTHAQWADTLGITRQAIAWAVRRGIATEYIEAHLAAGPGERVVCRHMAGYTPRRAGRRYGGPQEQKEDITMTNNTSVINHTITCPICGAAAHKIYASDITIFDHNPKPMTLYHDSKLRAIGCDHCLTISATGKTKEYAVGTDEPVVLPQWRGYEGDVVVDKDGVIVGRADHIKAYDADELLLHLDLSEMNKCPCCGHRAETLYVNGRMGDDAIGCDNCFRNAGIGQYLKSAADAIKHRWRMRSLVAFDGREPRKSDVYPVIRRIRPDTYNYKAAIKMMHQARPAITPYDSLVDGYIAVDELELDEEKTAEVAVALEWLGILDD